MAFFVLWFRMGNVSTVKRGSGDDINADSKANKYCHYKQALRALCSEGCNKVKAMCQMWGGCHCVRVSLITFGFSTNLLL